MAFKLFLRISAVLSYLIPKKRGYYVFIPVHNKQKLSGNIRALLMHLLNKHPELDAGLIALNKNLSPGEKLPRDKRPLKAKWKILWAGLRAEHLIMDAGALVFSQGHFSVIQLWHGAGFKKLGLLNKNSHGKLLEGFQQAYAQYALVVASSETNRQKQNDSFNTDKAVITGLPRNDVFFNGGIEPGKLHQKYQLNGFERIITYVPTYRDFETTPPFSDGFWQKLDEVLEQQNALFVVKKHPWEKYLEVPSGFDHIRDLSDQVGDVQELLVLTDLLISDYSSIMTDFAITGKPILVYAYDLETYIKKCRTLYYDLEDVLPKPLIRAEKDLLEKLMDESWLESPDVKQDNEKFRKTFHYYFDGGSSERVLDEISKL